LRARPSYVFSPGSSLRASANRFVSELPAVDEDAEDAKAQSRDGKLFVCEMPAVKEAS
jgi:hypothetical protein